MDWKATDWVALYGAFLATILGLIQWAQWRRSQNFLIIVNATVHEFGSEDAKGSDLGIVITNRSNLEIFVHSCWAGYSLRRWLTPWRREVLEAVSTIGVDEKGFLTGKSAGYFDLAPGKRAEVHIERKSLIDMDKPSWRYGFAARKCVAVDHSASSESSFFFDV